MKKRFQKTIVVSGGKIHFDLTKGVQVDGLVSIAEKVAEEAARRSDTSECVDICVFGLDFEKRFDQIFGEGATVKTFGTTRPSVFQVEEFFKKLNGLMDAWLSELEVE